MPEFNYVIQGEPIKRELQTVALKTRCILSRDAQHISIYWTVLGMDHQRDWGLDLTGGWMDRIMIAMDTLLVCAKSKW